MNANGIFVLCTLAWTASPVSADLASTVGASSIALATPSPAEWFATVVHEIRRGSFPGDFAPPQLYGGSVYRDFPVALSEAGAIYAVLGPPDERFVSLPGGPGVTGTAFKGAYVDVGFGVDFGPNTLLKIYEVGDYHERAQLFLWTNAGGNIQPVLTTNSTGVIALDLRGYSSVLKSMRATAFTKVGTGGRDELGPSKGFDLDAVSIMRIP